MSEEMVDDQSHYEISLTAGQAFLAFVLLLLSLAASFAFGLTIGKGQGDERLIVRKEPGVIQEGGLLAGTKTKSGGRIIDVDAGNHSGHEAAEVTDTTATTPVVEDAPTATTVTTDAFAASAATPPAAPAAATDSSTAVPKPVISESSKPVAPKPAVADTPLRAAVETARDTPKPAPRPEATAPKLSTAVRSELSKPAIITPYAARPDAAKAASTSHLPYYAQLLSTYEKSTAETLAARLIDGGFTGAYVERTLSEKGTVYRVRIKYASEAEARAAADRLRTYSRDVWVTR